MWEGFCVLRAANSVSESADAISKTQHTFFAMSAKEGTAGMFEVEDVGPSFRSSLCGWSVFEFWDGFWGLRCGLSGSDLFRGGRTVCCLSRDGREDVWYFGDGGGWSVWLLLTDLLLDKMSAGGSRKASMSELNCIRVLLSLTQLHFAYQCHGKWQTTVVVHSIDRLEAIRHPIQVWWNFSQGKNALQLFLVVWDPCWYTFTPCGCEIETSLTLRKHKFITGFLIACEIQINPITIVPSHSASGNPMAFAMAMTALILLPLGPMPNVVRSPRSSKASWIRVVTWLMTELPQPDLATSTKLTMKPELLKNVITNSHNN